MIQIDRLRFYHKGEAFMALCCFCPSLGIWLDRNARILKFDSVIFGLIALPFIGDSFVPDL